MRRPDRRKSNLRHHRLATGRPFAVPFAFIREIACNISPVAGVYNVSMKTNILLTLVATLAVIGCGLTSAPAQNTQDAAAGGKPERGRLLQRIAQKLQLTEDQKSQIKAAWSEEKNAVLSLVSQLHDARRNLHAAIHADKASETAVRAAAARVAVVEADLAVERMKLYGKIASILTDEQRRKIADFEERVDDRISAVIARLGDTPAN